MYIGDSADYNYNVKVPGGPFLHIDDPDSYFYDARAYIDNTNPFDQGRGVVWPYGKENWVNLEGKYIHLVADQSAHIGTASGSETVSVCSLSVFGTKYVRDDSVPTSLTVTRGLVSTISVGKIYSVYQIGNTLDIKLRQKTDFDFVIFYEKENHTDLSIDGEGITPGTYNLIIESFDSNSNVQSALKTDTIQINIVAGPP